MHNNIGTDKLSAFNKHVLKDYLATAANICTIKSESSRVYSAGIWKLQSYGRDSPKDKANIEKLRKSKMFNYFGYFISIGSEK